jgi:hypothetical protein
MLARPSLFAAFFVVALAIVSALAWGAVAIHRQMDFQRKIDRLAALASRSVPAEAGFHERVDAARDFVYRNSVHNMDSEFYSIWRDKDAVAAAVLDYATGKRAKPPHLECSTRSGLLGQIFRTLGYRVRAVVLFSPDENLVSHTMLEILNPHTGRWEIQGADNDTWWRSIGDGKRASVADIIAAPSRFEPCRAQTCGWENLPKDDPLRVIRPYLKIASVIDYDSGARFTIYGADVDPQRVYSLNGRIGAFCQILAKNCRDGFAPASSLAGTGAVDISRN